MIKEGKEGERKVEVEGGGRERECERSERKG